MMKTNCRCLTCITVLLVATAFGQQPSAPGLPPQAPRPLTPAPAPGPTPTPVPPSGFQERLANIVAAKSEPVLMKFNLNFHGGTPGELVLAIEKALGRPLNVIVPEDLAGTKLPALEMNNVDVSQLFAALLMASRKSEVVPGSYGNYQISQTTCGFKTDGRPSDDSIWYFFVERPVVPPPPTPQKVCRFYSLAPYLEGTATVDDITTAIQTGWKMLGDTSPPTISFHKDTKLLIAVGEPSKLETIDAVLKALQQPGSAGVGMGAAPVPMRVLPPSKPAENPKSEH